MSVTGDLRAMLDERDVKYMVDDYSDYEVTEWNGPYNLWWRFTYDPYDDVPYGEVQLLDTGGATHLTPAQAIAATLGAETCHLEEIDKGLDTASEYMIKREWCFDAVYRCSCGCRFGHAAHNRPRYCPNCGKRIEVDECANT